MRRTSWKGGSPNRNSDIGGALRRAGLPLAVALGLGACATAPSTPAESYEAAVDRTVEKREAGLAADMAERQRPTRTELRASRNVPVTRPLAERTVERLDDVDVVVVEDYAGVGVGWRSAGVSASKNPISQIGQVASVATGNVLGLMGSAVTTGVRDAAPSARVNRVAALANRGVDSRELSLSLRQAVADAAEANAEQVRVDLNAPRVRSLASSRTLGDALYIDPTYTLSADGKTLRVVVDAAIIAPGLSYTDVNGNLRHTSRAQVYANRFAYFSEPLPHPILGDEAQAVLRRATYQAHLASGGRRKGRKAARAMAAVEDGIWDDQEVALLVANQWSQDGGERLRAEVDAAHAFVAAALMKDLAADSNATELDPGTLAAVADDRRRVVKIPDGKFAGALISEPTTPGFNPDFGNTTKMAVKNRVKRSRVLAGTTTGMQPGDLRTRW